MNPSVLEELTIGLQAKPAHIAPKFFYDELGSKLFEAITLLDEYYPTRTEAYIMSRHLDEISAAVGDCDALVDLGAGNCAKASTLFESLQPKQYWALDISKTFLDAAIANLQKQFPQIAMVAQACDLSQAIQLPDIAAQKKIFFYPGSSIGNFDPKEAHLFLQGVAQLLNGSGGLLIGVDLVKNRDVLHRAYNDSLGITAAFNCNVLLHINRLIGTNFCLEDWEHDAFFNEQASRIEMHLRAKRDVQVIWGGHLAEFSKGETIHTENSYKYTQAGFQDLLKKAGFQKVVSWTDQNQHFMVCFASFR
jgi:dimethylhistidine N-methyltransferase